MSDKSDPGKQDAVSEAEKLIETLKRLLAQAEELLHEAREVKLPPTKD